MVRYRKGVSEYQGVVLDDAAESGSRVLIANGRKTHSVKRSAVRQIPSLERLQTSPAYRLHLAATNSPAFDVGAGGLERFPDLGHLLIRRDELLRDTGEARRFARCAALAGDSKSIAQLDALSETERTWVEMWAHHNEWVSSSHWEAATAAMDLLIRLPADRYPDKLCLALANWHRCRDDERLREAIIGASRAFADHALGTLVLAVADDESLDISGRILAAFEALSERPMPGVKWTFLSEARSRVRSVLGALDGGAVDLQPPALLELPLAALDDLIDRGAFPASAALEARALGHPHGPYLVARTDPTLLTDSEVVETGHELELARRAIAGGVDLPAGVAGGLSNTLAAARVGDLEALRSIAVTAESEQVARTARMLADSLERGVLNPQVLRDRSVWPIVAHLVPVEGDLTRASPTISEFVQWVAIETSRQNLYEWNYGEALGAARECLRVARDEGIRDEALNYVAIAQYMLGNADAAADALEHALEGTDSPELIINYGVIAGDERRGVASRTLGRLSLEASTIDLRLTAARRALHLWSTRAPGDESDEPPEELVIAMRALATEATPLDEHISIMRFLSWADVEWVTEARNTVESPHSSTVAHKYLTAYAMSLSDGIEVLAKWNEAHAGDAFVVEESQRLADMTTDALFEGEDWNAGLAAIALEIATAGLPVNLRSQVLIRILGVREIVGIFFNEENPSIPKESIFAHLVQARALLTRMSEDEQERIQPFLDRTADAYGRLAFTAWAQEHDAIGEAYNEMMSQISYRVGYRVNWTVVAKFGRELIEAIDNMFRYLTIIRPFVVDSEVGGSLDGLSESLGELRQLIRQGARL